MRMTGAGSASPPSPAPTAHPDDGFRDLGLVVRGQRAAVLEVARTLQEWPGLRIVAIQDAERGSLEIRSRRPR